MRLHFALRCAAASALVLAPLQLVAQALTASPDSQVVDETVRTLGLFVTKARLSKMSATGLQAIPQGSLVTVVENAAGIKFAVFRQVRVPLNDLALVSNDPQLIAAASTPKNAAGQETSPGSVVRNTDAMAPEATSNEKIKLDADGNIISRVKTTKVSDGNGNTTTITQGEHQGMTPELAARIAAGRVKAEQQRRAIWEFKNVKRYEKAIVSGYESKLRAMEDLLVRMEAEIARLEATGYQR